MAISHNKPNPTTIPVPTNNANKPTAAFDRVANMTKQCISKQTKAILKSWIKVAIAGSIACYMAGARDWTVIVDAGLVAVLPVIHSWFDKSDKRFGRKK